MYIQLVLDLASFPGQRTLGTRLVWDSATTYELIPFQEMALCFPVFQQWQLLPVLEERSDPGTSTSKRKIKQPPLRQSNLDIFHLLNLYLYKQALKLGIVLFQAFIRVHECLGTTKTIEHISQTKVVQNVMHMIAPIKVIIWVFSFDYIS